jgi:thymidylate synthase (FAD)
LTEISVLNAGFVRLESHMGSDLTVVNAARVSFGKRSNMLTDADAKLIRYLAKHKHWTPFAHPQVTLHLKMPIFVARQWMRSNVGVVWNEISRRYVDSEPEFYIPEIWRCRPSGGIKQGSGTEQIVPQPFGAGRCRNCGVPIPESGAYEDACKYAADQYRHLLDSGVAPEMARVVLPQSTFTEVWGTFSLASVHRICSLRLDPHAQWEIQQYAQAVDKIVGELFPVSWAALTNRSA